MPSPLPIDSHGQKIQVFTPRTGVMNKELELISQARTEVAKPAEAPIKKFTDRVILNKLN